MQSVTLTERAKTAAPGPAKIAAADNRLKTLGATMKRHQYQPDALIEVLHTAQELFGYLDPELFVFFANGLKFPRVGCMVSRFSITSSPCSSRASARVSSAWGPPAM